MTEESHKLLQKARESIEAAKLLLTNGHEGFSAARAYYAMFYASEALLLERGFRFSKHSAVHAAFGKEFVKTQQIQDKFHRYLLEAYDERILGDYESSEDVSPRDAEEIIQRAEEFLKMCQDQLEKSGS